MGMFPIFLLGLIVGIIAGWTCTNAYYSHKQDIPSDAKIHIQEAQITALRYDIETLEAENKRLNEELTKTKKPRTPRKTTTVKKKKEE